MVFTRYYVAVGALGWQHLFKLRTFVVVWTRKLLFMFFLLFFLIINRLTLLALLLIYCIFIAFGLSSPAIILSFCIDTFLVFHHKCEFHTNRELQLMPALNEKPPGCCHSYSTEEQLTNSIQ